MEAEQYLEKVLKSYQRYYNIKTSDVAEPFSAEAEFISHSEQYVLVKIAKIAEMDTKDFVYFKTCECLTAEELLKLSLIAWETGTSKVQPYNGHRNSDVTLVILADKIEDSAAKLFKKIKYSKSYKFGFYGWSNFKLAAIEVSSGRLFSNRLGSDTKKILAKK